MGSSQILVIVIVTESMFGSINDLSRVCFGWADDFGSEC